jgi:hypothetical protein
VIASTASRTFPSKGLMPKCAKRRRIFAANAAPRLIPSEKLISRLKTELAFASHLSSAKLRARHSPSAIGRTEIVHAASDGNHVTEMFIRETILA